MELPSTIDTATLREITGYSKARLVDLENEKVIARSDVNTWPYPETLTKIIAHLRERVRKTAVSDDRSRWEAARAQREELKTQKLSGELCRVSDFNDLWLMLLGAVVTRLNGLPARVTRDLAQRQTIEREIDKLRHEVADEFAKRAAELGGGKAA
jgi:phage terminase Nu1 subunit (DNA packaging protein)